MRQVVIALFSLLLLLLAALFEFFQTSSMIGSLPVELSRHVSRT